MTLVIGRFISSLARQLDSFVMCALAGCDDARLASKMGQTFVGGSALFTGRTSRLNKRPRSEMSPKFVHHFKLSTDSLDWTHLIRIDVGSQRLRPRESVATSEGQRRAVQHKKCPTLAEISGKKEKRRVFRSIG